MLKLDHVTLKFGGLVANNDISFSVKKGEIFGLIGPNGAGKTTLFNVISGVYAPTEGKVYFNGRDIGGVVPHEINKLGIARTYQNINLFTTLSVLDNVKVGRHVRTRAGLFSSIFRTPRMRREENEIIEYSMELLKFMGLDHLAHTPSGSLSYGQQRKLEIARAMATEPEMILLDEPVAGMNTGEKAEMCDTIHAIREKGLTVFIVEHDMKVITRITHNIAVLNYGKLIALGDPQVVLNDEQVIQAYLGGVEEVG
jgi:branched-chain amino acid transport system ATP-binding protein